jgi:hypothetical protein
MRGTADKLRIRRRRFGMLFSIVTGLMVSLTVAAARAADLALPTDEKILQALKAKRLTRCPHAGRRLGCGGARLRNPAPKGRVATSKSPSMTAPPLFRVRAILFAGRFGNQVFDSAERVRVTAAPLCSDAGPYAWRGAVVLEDGGIACDAAAPAGADYTSACWTGIDRRRLPAIHHRGSVSADYCERLTPVIRAIERGKIRFQRSGPRDVRGRCVGRYAMGGSRRI